MKNIMKLFALMVVATVALSCVNEPEELVGGKKVNISLTTEQTKVYVSNASDDTADAYHFALDGDEKVAISYNEGALQMVQLDGDTTATFEVEDDNSGAHKFLVMTEWHKSLNGNGVSAYTNGLARVTVPYVQTIRSDRKDEIGLMPNRFGQVLYGVTEEYESLPENISLTLKHATAYGKVDIKNFALTEGETLQQVQIVADKAISGTFDFNPETTEWSVNEKDSATKNRYVINVKTSSLEDVWFSCRPNDALAEVTIHLQTNKCIYKKTISFAESAKPLQFKAGEISRFTVDMTNALSQVVTDDAANFNPQEDEKYFIVISSETGAATYPSGDFVLRNSTCSLNPRAYQFPTVAQMGVDNFLWRIIKNDDGTFSFLSLDPTAVDGEGNFNEYLWQCDGQAQGVCVQVDGNEGGNYNKKTYVNTFRLFDNTDEKYSDSFYMTSTINIDADGVGTRWVVPYFYTAIDKDNGAPTRYVSMRCNTGTETNKYRVRFIKYEEGKSTWDAQWALPGGDDEAAYMIIFDYWYNTNAKLVALTHGVTAGLDPTSLNNKMIVDEFKTDSANGLYSYTRPAEVGPFGQGTLEVAEDFDYANYTWYIKRDTSNPGTYFIYYKDEDGKNHYLTQYNNGTNLKVDQSSYTKNFKFISYIYDNQEVLGLVVDNAAGTGFRYAGYYWDTDVRSISKQESCYSNIYLHKIPTASAE